MQLANKSFLFGVLIFISLSNYSFNYKRQENKKLIIGKWIYKSQEVGNITIVFNKDGYGFRTTDSSKTSHRFKYVIIKDTILKLSIASYKPEFHYIKELTVSKLSIREYPIKTIRESISFYDTDYKRE